MHTTINGILLAATLLSATACSNRTGRSVEVHDLENRVWSAPQDFYYDNSDTLLQRDISIVVRYDRGYVADSVAMNILCVSPDSLVFEEPFTLRIPRIGDMRPEEHSFVYRHNVQLARTGRYLFRLTPKAPAQGIASVGIVVDETTSNSK